MNNVVLQQMFNLKFTTMVKKNFNSGSLDDFSRHFKSKFKANLFKRWTKVETMSWHYATHKVTELFNVLKPILIISKYFTVKFIRLFTLLI